MTKSLRLSLLAMSMALALGAVDWSALKPQGCASDFAGVIDPATRQQLEAYCQGVEQATGARIAFVTLSSLEGEPIDDVGRAIFRAWGMEQNKGPGILLLLAIGEQRGRMQVADGLREVLPGGLDQQILLEMRPAVRAKQYGEAMLAAATTIGDALARAKHASLKIPMARRIHRTVWDLFPWPVLLGASVLFVWLMLSGGTRGYGGHGREALWSKSGGFLPGLGNPIGRAGWGSRGSGGFGGYDSDDSFCAFGGCGPKRGLTKAPGGGASTDW
ncbi:MAG: TPM domain-containing protein [Acidobacteriia bacterium]|nr:TPM domain-containing protein [Terriglobia bacterium]